jgi:hypothetical protein
MKRKQSSQEQIVAILHQAERGEKPITELCRETRYCGCHLLPLVRTVQWDERRGCTMAQGPGKRAPRLKRLLAERDLAIDP